MLFNSYEFIFIFLPIVVLGYYLIAATRQTLAARLWLVASSLLFYGWWKAIYLPLLMTSACCNYAIGTALGKKQFTHPKLRKGLLALGISANLFLLGYFKYTNFFLETSNSLFNTSFPHLPIILPLAISFFTFQKIAYLVDSYRRQTEGYSFINYLLFVSFFPQLIAGPIVHHKEIVSQFEKEATYQRHWDNFAKGIVVFIIGLAKKTVIADNIAVWATHGFDGLTQPNALQAWTAALSYTMQLYFDFSGYTDMAIGGALLFNITLPENFNSPYQSHHIRDFWRRWHMTLSRFLRDYIYIPLGGNRATAIRSAGNMLFTFLVGGLWHGAAWTFVFWGFFHGCGIVTHVAWEKQNRRLPVPMARALTFLFVLIGWVFFRAKTWTTATTFLKAMFGGAPLGNLASLRALNVDPLNTLEFMTTAGLLTTAVAISFFGENTRTIQLALKPHWKTALWVSLLALAAFLCSHHASEFLYFNF